MIKRFLWIIAFLCLIPTALSAATQEVTDCTVANVQAAHDACADTGDEVFLNCATATWSSGQVAITKAVKFRGISKTGTVLTTNMADPFAISRTTAGTVRFTGIGFAGAVTNQAVIVANGYNYTLIMDHVDDQHTGTVPLVMAGYQNQYTTETPIVGLIYDITGSAKVLQLYGSHYSWLEDDNLGSGAGFYLEDLTITRSTTVGAASHIVDVEAGGRLTVRYNTLVNARIATHDSGSTGTRGIRTMEVYGNSFDCTRDTCSSLDPIDMRGGTGVIFDNTINSVAKWNSDLAGAQVYRATNSDGHTPFGSLCDGTPEKVCSDFRGFCSGGTNDGTSCISNTPCTGGGTCQSYCTSDAQCGARTCVQMDGQSDATGWPCRDQTGRGKDNATTHVQALSPMFVWNNRDESSNLLSATVPAAYADYVKINRDYCEYTSTPGTACNGVTLSYTPYGTLISGRYYHPLRDDIPTSYTVTSSKVGAGGTLSYEGEDEIATGENSRTYTATPDNGWRGTWSGTCGATGTGTTYQKTNVTADCTVVVTFDTIKIGGVK